MKLQGQAGCFVQMLCSRGGKPDVSSIQSRENHELVKEKGIYWKSIFAQCNTTLKMHAYFLHMLHIFFMYVFLIGGEDSYCLKEKKCLCGRRSEVLNICQSKVRDRQPSG